MSERKPSLYLVVGAKWGDEGKGKIIYYYVSQGVDLVIRSQGGPNAGHSIVKDDNTSFAVHGVPSGILDRNTKNIVGPGVLVNPVRTIEEIRDLEQKTGEEIRNLMISEQSTLIMPYDQILDRLNEETKGDANNIGTTKQGIGHAASGRATRDALRVEDLKDIEGVLQKLPDILKDKKAIFEFYAPQIIEAMVQSKRSEEDVKAKKAELETQRQKFNLDYYPDKLREWQEKLGRFIGDTTPIVAETLDKGGRVLVEGAQGTLLDNIYGNYPYVTSTHTTTGGLLLGAGISPAWVLDTDFKNIGIQKAFDTRVGNGPFPTEMPEEIALKYRDGTEEGVVTGRPRRLGYIDGVASRYSRLLNRFTDIVITKMDKIEGEMPICTSYILDGVEKDYFPTKSLDLARCQPIYRRQHNLSGSLEGLTNLADIPETHLNYIKDIMNDYRGARLLAIGTGRRNSELVFA